MAPRNLGNTLQVRLVLLHRGCHKAKSLYVADTEAADSGARKTNKIRH